MLDETNPYKKYDGQICKVILKNFREGRPIKGVFTVVSSQLARVKGDFLDTTFDIENISLITTKVGEK